MLGGRSLDDALEAVPAGPERPLLKALSYGALRDHRLLAALVDAMVERPLPDDPELRALLRIGVFQLRSMGVAPHAAVNETVAAVEPLKKGWARGFVNALLRRYQREREALERALPADAGIRLSYPAWLVEAVRRDWGAQADAVLAAGNERAPMTLRVNRRRGDVAAAAARLASQNLPARALAAAPDALVLENPLPVDELPGFADGELSVQDASAQLAVEFMPLDTPPRSPRVAREASVSRGGYSGRTVRILDACAAPGGKAAHLLERHELELTALDVDPARLARVEDTFRRLGLDARCIAGDAGAPKAWWDGQPFDRILLDAPCSGTGVIRRHPDIKWLRRAADITRLAATQRRMLDALWPLLAPGGVLLYSVCSILDPEGSAVVAAFLDAHADAAPRSLSAAHGPACGAAHGAGWRIAPGGDWDGFFYAALEKRA